MEKTKKLNALFSEWENNIPEYKRKFIRDGIVNEERFIKQEKKVLFICKEPNNPEQGSWDFREWWKEGILGTFSNSISEWAYGILNDFPLYDTLTNKKREEALSSIAFMNLKKVGGGGTANNEVIIEHIKKNKDYLIKQIEIISPTIIVGGLSITSNWNYLFDDIKFAKSGHGIAVSEWNKIPIIDFYHPSMRSGRPLSYALLKLVVESLKK